MDEKYLNNTINGNIDETEGLASGLEVLKIRKTSSRIDIENLNKVSDERHHIDKGCWLDKKIVYVKEVSTGNNEVLKSGIIISQSCNDRDSGERYQKVNYIETHKLGIMSSQNHIDKYSDERDQRENDDETDKLVIMSSQICIDKYSDKRDQGGNYIEIDKLGIMSSQSCIDNDYDERYQI